MRERLYGKALEQYDEMLQVCDWFDFRRHFLVTIEDSSGNIEEIVGVGSNFTNSKRALRAGWKRIKSYSGEYSVSLYEKGWLRSYVI